MSACSDSKRQRSDRKMRFMVENDLFTPAVPIGVAMKFVDDDDDDDDDDQQNFSCQRGKAREQRPFLRLGAEHH